MGLFDRRHLTEEYMDEIRKQTDPYSYFCLNEDIARGEVPDTEEVPYCTIRDLRAAVLGDGLIIPGDKQYLFIRDDKSEHETAGLCECLKEIPSADLIYWDDDRTYEGKRHVPFFKPDYSPDTLLNCNYIGESFLVSTELAFRIMEEMRNAIPAETEEGTDLSLEEGLSRLADTELKYDLLLRISEQTDNFVHIPRVLSHIPDESADEDEIYSEYTWQNQSQKFIRIRNESLARRGWGIRYEKVFERKDNSVINNNVINNIVIKPERDELDLSVIIPSKDNSDILINCLESIKSCFKDRFGKKLEIIVVDNGSGSAQGLKIEDYLKEYNREIPVKYIYKEMDFNYSLMCNIGAGKASNRCLLFLNDDIELIDENTLERMYACACLDHVGAVGAKLYYPQGNIIQHTGITVSLDCGPTHKLSSFTDDKPYYYGRNVFNQNVLALTGACLCVDREKYFKYGGFNDKMKVGYNDVELCVRLYEAGLVNVVLNECILFHHESLSRGADHKDDAKYARLKEERAMLYDLHPWIREKGDPYYSVNLIPDNLDYTVNVVADHEKRSSRSSVIDDPGISSRIIKLMDRDDGTVRYDKTGNRIYKGSRRLHFNIERTDTFRGIMKDEEDYFLIEGWATLTGRDNALYDTYLALVDEDDGCLIFDTFRKNREDVAVVFVNEKNLFLTGFKCKIPVKLLGRDTRYRLAMIKVSGLTGRKYIKLGDAYEPYGGWYKSGE
ncbi:MAG: glycosyltransferase [Lachnospiraceae bacterium]|nr:glycosyltransferase [Lachnospiraceae bacterium]